MDTHISGSVALVSGGSGAIGSAIAQALAAEGAHVAIGWHHQPDRAKTVADAVTASGGVASTVQLDLHTPAAAPTAIETVQRELGPVAGLVANAVAWPNPDADDLDSLGASLIANVAGSAALADAALPGMRAGGWSRIVLISTDIVAQPLPGPAAYAAAKGALEATARVLAVREAPHGILTNVVRPGLTQTNTVRTASFLGEQVIRQESERTPTGRICTPEDVASAVTYLGSAANSHVNGQIISVSGGRELTR